MLLVVIGLGFWLYNMGTSSDGVDKSAPSTAAATSETTPASTMPAIAEATTPAAAADSGRVLTGKNAAAAFSDYVGALQEKLFLAQMTMQIHAGQIQQAVQFNDLNKYRKSAEDLEDSIRKVSADISAINAPENVTDADSPPFEDAQSAATDIVAQYLEVAADIGVNAHTGLNSSDAMEQDAKEVPKLQAKFTRVVQQGYRHFGMKLSDVNPATLTLKDSASR